MPNGQCLEQYYPEIPLSTRVEGLEYDIVKLRKQNEELKNKIVELNETNAKLEKALAKKVIME